MLERLWKLSILRNLICSICHSQIYWKQIFTVLYFASLLWFYFSKTGIMSESFNVSRSFFMNWAKNWKVPIWFRKKKKNKDFWDFRVFEFALYRRSKTQKSRKFRLPQIMILIAYQDLKTPKKSIYTKTKRLQFDLEQKGKFSRFPSFRFCSVPKIENLEISENSLLIRILTV